jgi:hypothetical protein
VRRHLLINWNNSSQRRGILESCRFSKNTKKKKIEKIKTTNSADPFASGTPFEPVKTGTNFNGFSTSYYAHK